MKISHKRAISISERSKYLCAEKTVGFFFPLLLYFYTIIHAALSPLEDALLFLRLPTTAHRVDCGHTQSPKPRRPRGPHRKSRSSLLVAKPPPRQYSSSILYVHTAGVRKSLQTGDEPTVDMSVKTSRRC